MIIVNQNKSEIVNIDSSECTLWEEEIKTILTKESYMANCYKVGGEDEKI